MYTVKTMNNISDIIKQTLKAPQYEVGPEQETYDALMVRSADLHETAFPQTLLAIARAGAGVNNIPVEACTEQGIVVFNTPGANANAVKELVLCGMLLSCRKVIEGTEWVRDAHARGETGIGKLAEKAKKQFVGPELLGKKLGVVGLGAIGVLVSNAASDGLGMEVMGYDPFLSVEGALRLSRSVKLTADLDALFKECDYVTLHLPLNDQTRGMVNEKVLHTMKDGAGLLNFARGGLVDDEAVRAAVKTGKLRHYVTDFADDAIAGQDGVIVMPHLGASTPESEENCAVMAAAEMHDYLQNGNITHSVNLPDCVMPRADGCRVTVINRNVANMVGQMTAVLAAEGLNIENMINKSRGAYAYTMFDRSAAPGEEALMKLRQIEGVLRIRVLP